METVREWHGEKMTKGEGAKGRKSEKKGESERKCHGEKERKSDKVIKEKDEKE